LQDSDHHTLCLDGASKGNPGAAGAGGDLYGTEGKIESTFSWNLSSVTNNQVEVYALLQGLAIARSKDIITLSIVGDSNNTITQLRLASLPLDAWLCGSSHAGFSLLKFCLVDSFY
jgi:ribonuclease HI